MSIIKRYIAVFFVFPVLGFSQNTKLVTLKQSYQPETTYKQAIVQKHTTVIAYKANEDVLNVLKEQGIQNPTVQKMESDYISELHAGKSLDNKTFPITIRFIKAPDSFGRNGITSATKIYGHGETDIMPKIDSIVAPEMDTTLKKSMLTTIDAMLTQVKFPQKSFKKGDTQQVISPVTVPLAGTMLEMDLITDYTLVEVKNNIARFNISIMYKTKTSDPKFRISGAGSGKGFMDYDIKKAFPIAQQSDTFIKMGFTYKEFDMEITSNMHYDIKCEIFPDAK